MLRMTTLLTLLVLIQMTAFAGRSPIVRLGKEGPRTLQMIGAMSPRMLHRISADLKPDASKVVHIQVPYYIERPKAPARPQKKKQYQPWPPAATIRGQRFVSNTNPFQQLSGGSPIPFSPAAFPYTPIRQSPPKTKGLPAFEPGVHDVPGPYDTPFVPVMKPSPVNPLHREPPPEIMFEPISILPLEAPSFDTLRNHVNFLKHKQAAFFEGQGREFGFGPYGDDGTPLTVHHGDDEEAFRDGGERNTLSEDDFGQNDRKYDRRGLQAGNGDERGVSEEDDEDFYDPDGKEHDQEDPEREEDDFEDSREEVRQVSTFEPKKTYTQVRHQETVRHVPRSKVPDENDESRHRDDDDDDEADEDDRADNEGEDNEDGEEDHRSSGRAPIKERVKVARKNIVYSEKGREAAKFDHGSEESFGQFEQQQQPQEQPKRKKSKRQRIKRDTVDSSKSEDQMKQLHSKEEAVPEPLAIDAIILFANLTGADSLPLAEALTDPRELHGDELIRFLDEAIQNTTQYLPEPSAPRNPEVINIVSPPSNVVKFPYYYRPASEIDVDSALRYAENLTTFSTGPYASRADVVCNEVDVDIAEEPEPIADGEGGFRPIKRLQGLGDKIDCLKVRHFGKEPLDNPLFHEEFVGVPRQVFTVGMASSGSKGATVAPATASRQPNPAVAVYNDVIRHIKKHLASQQRRKNSKADEQDTVMIAVPRVMRLPADEAAREDQQSATGVQRPTQKREARILTFPEANPTLLSNHVGIPIFDISKYFPRFMMRANDDLYAEEPELKTREPRFSTPKPTPKRSTPKAQLQSLVRTAERLAEGAVTVEESVERQLASTEKPRDDIADAFDDVLTRQPLITGSRPLPPPIKPYDVVEHTKDDGPEPTYDKSGPPYAALALEPPVAQSILSQRLEPIKRNQLDFLKAKRAAVTKPSKAIVRKRPQRPTVTRKKVLVFYHR
ncbi:uncharacterized protein LOC126576871 [Anopheles aquasalis]|uniref:uncharacterized protein LOC126576871 n=1 Tax=Anopheles aquasalis TaxID=42839 RepID=UPI00215A7E68|nr:uncharacterized protein LOC126576871 [Anopheles aquasalis]